MNKKPGKFADAPCESMGCFAYVVSLQNSSEVMDSEVDYFMVTVATFETETDAEPVKERLEKAGLHAEIQYESPLQTFWMSHDHANVKLKVDNEEMGTARHLLK